MFDGERVWAVVGQGDPAVLTAADSGESRPLPDGVSEIALGQRLFFRRCAGEADGEADIWELAQAGQDHPLMVTCQLFDDLRLQDGHLVWTTYTESPAFLYDTEQDCFLRFDSLPRGLQFFCFAGGAGFLQLRTDDGLQYYRLREK